MKKISIFSLFTIAIIVFQANKINAQQYNEEKTIAQLEKYLENPKSYYDKLKALTDQLKQAQVSSIQKDSIINALGGKTAKSSPTATSKPSVNTNSPYKVQLAALHRDDLKKYLEIPKYLSFTNLGDRNVFEVAGFTNEQDAFEFSQYLRKSGIRDAFVTKYDNGVRQESYNYFTGKSSSILNSNHAKSSRSENQMNLDYPSSVPLGYQEIMSGKTNLTASAAAAIPPSKVAKAIKPKANTTNTTNPTNKALPKAPATPTAINPANSTPENSSSKSSIDEAFSKIFGK